MPTITTIPTKYTPTGNFLMEVDHLAAEATRGRARAAGITLEATPEAVEALLWPSNPGARIDRFPTDIAGQGARGVDLIKCG